VLSTSELERALAAAGLHAPVRFEEVTGSTNATALDLADRGWPEWTLVAADHQTAGRGRLGRTWVDRPGDSLMFSYVLRPERLDPSSAGLVPLLAGAAMAGAASEVAGVEVLCKWPNDLLLGGEKVGGILVESAVVEARIRHVVVGIGVNVVAPAGVHGAAGLGEVDRVALLARFLERFRDGYARLPAGVTRAWTLVSATLGREVEVRRLDGPPMRGRAVAVDDRGALVVETAEGPVAVGSGEVEHLADG